MRRGRLRDWIARWIAGITAAVIVAFALTTAFVFWLHEVLEVSDDGEPEGFDREDAIELAIQLLAALAVAAPVGILLAGVGVRGMSRHVGGRIDAIIATAGRLRADDLRARLPVSPHDDEFDELARALNELFARLEAGFDAQRRFAADASHELRSPLAVLTSDLEVARRRPRDPAAWEAVADRALDEARRMSVLVDALLLLARAGAVRRGAIEWAEFVGILAERWGDVATEAGVVLVVDAPAGALAAIDPAMLAIAAGNLIANAIAHAPIGSAVRVSVALDESVALLVDDAGPGVPPDQRARIFEPFVRGDAPTADRVPGRAGLGLGLAIARSIVEAHEGRISVETSPAGGARFILRLRRAHSTIKAPPSISPA